MSAAEDSVNRRRPGPVGQGVPGESLREDVDDSGWSALMDGSATPAELDELFSIPVLAGSLERWDAYRVVGDALRGESALVGQVPAADFLRGFHARLAAEESPATRVPTPRESGVSVSIATQNRGTAANDAAFRWKMIAMAASVSAVMAVSWGVLGLGGAGNAPAVGPVVASVEPAARSEAVAPVGVPSREGSVVVNTPQGPLIRDARLEALMAEHRQYGGMSALQMPAGFLRNATYDAPER